MSPDDVAALHPYLYHLTRPESLPAIREHGLLSAQAICERFDVPFDPILTRRRPHSVTLTHPDHGTAVINDNAPLSERALEKCLNDGLSPSNWLRLLNNRVFFWVDPARYERLRKGPAHKASARIVLVFDTRTLLMAHHDRAAISPINTGSTLRKPARRGLSTFAPLTGLDYQAWRRSRPKKTLDRIVELSIAHSVPDAMDHCVEVRHVQ